MTSYQPTQITRELFSKVVGFTYGDELVFNFRIRDNVIYWQEEDYEDIYEREMPVTIFLNKLEQWSNQ